MVALTSWPALGQMVAPGDETPAPPAPTAGNSRRAWTRLSQPEDIPVNLANRAISGCSILSSQGVREAEALISTDPTKDFEVPAGKGEVIIRLGGQQIINNVDFINDHIGSVLTIATSADNRTWDTVARTQIPERKREMEIHFSDVHCKYVRLSFDTTHGGQLRAFDFYGPMGRKDFKFATAAEAGVDTGGGDFNLAAAGIAQPIYAFPTPTNAMEAGMLHHVFKFPKTNERYRTIIYDLGSVFTLKEFSVAYSQRPVRVELFLFEQLSEKKDWRDRLSYDPANLDKVKPYEVFEDPSGHGHVKFKNQGEASARYVVLRYEPDYNRKAANAMARPTWSDFLPCLSPAGFLLTELLRGADDHHAVAGDTGAPFEHNDTNITPVGSFVLIPPATPTQHATTQDYGPAPFIPYSPGSLPGIPAPTSGRPPAQPPASPPPVVPPPTP